MELLFVLLILLFLILQVTQRVEFNAENDMERIMENAQNRLTEMRKESVRQTGTIRKAKSKKFKDEESKRKWEEMMTVKRRKVYTAMVKKEITKQQRSKCVRHKEALIQFKKISMQCQKFVRNKAVSINLQVYNDFKILV